MKRFPELLLLSAFALQASANKLDREGQYDKAEPLYAAAVREAEGFGPEDQRLAEALHNYGAHLFNAGRYQDSEGIFQRGYPSPQKRAGTVLCPQVGNDPPRRESTRTKHRRSGNLPGYLAGGRRVASPRSPI